MQTTLVGVIQNSTSRKIDVDDLKRSLANSVRTTRADQSGVQRQAASMMNSMGMGVTAKSRSKSRGAQNNTTTFDSAVTLQNKGGKHAMYEQADSVVPAWYKALKKNNAK